MFSGIVEATGLVSEYTPSSSSSRIRVSKPSQFSDLNIGDSIAVNGVCLTIEEFDEKQMLFCLGAETLKVTGWNKNSLKKVNLERSLKIGDRLHGHLVTGHVDGMGQILSVNQFGETTELEVKFPRALASYIWQKGSVCINGVSLTLNEVKESSFTVCLIPETLKRTNLNELQQGHWVALEIDNFARGWLRMKELEAEGRGE